MIDRLCGSPTILAAGALALLALGGCSRSNPDAVPTDLNGAEQVAPEAAPTPEPTPVPVPVPTIAAPEQNTAEEDAEAQAERAAAEQRQMEDDAAATGMTARMPREEPALANDEAEQ
ncbi:MAG TPA: hypothetical protein VFQ57_07820 [Sphingomonas sp.]|jgi:hypothetical protein|nr:hypothetical protein [Sphingomonas sp.]